MIRDGASVAVVIPTYNRAHLIRRAIKSVIAQTRCPDEIIVVDDGSTDNTESLLTSEFPDIRYIKQDNQGVSAARNTGIRQSTAQWIAFIDSDDEWLPSKLEKQCKALATDAESLICHTNEIWIRDGRRVNPMKKHNKSGGWIFRHCLPLCAMSPSSIVINRSLFDRVGLFDEMLPACEDYDLWLRITAGYSVLFVDEALMIKYGGHQDQLSRKYWGMDRFRIAALRNILQSGLLKPADEKAAREMLVEKAKIFIKGARKRNRYAEEAYYLSLCERYAPSTSNPK